MQVYNVLVTGFCYNGALCSTTYRIHALNRIKAAEQARTMSALKELIKVQVRKAY